MGWVIIIIIFVLAFILEWKKLLSDKHNQQSKTKAIEPVFDDGEIIAWYEEEE